MYGNVVDWISVTNFSVFNLADMSITLATITLVILELKSNNDKNNNDKKSKPIKNRAKKWTARINSWKKNSWNKHWHSVLQAHNCPHDIAIGFAIGTLIAILPTPGLNIFIGILIILISKNINKIALFGAMALWNPIAQVPLYVLSYKMGDLLFGALPVVEYDVSITYLVMHFTRRFLVGNSIVAVTMATLSYFVVKYIAQRAQKRKTQNAQAQNSSKLSKESK